MKSFESVEGRLIMPTSFKLCEFEVTAQLPMTISLDGGNLLDWEIIGGDGELGVKTGNNYYIPLTITNGTQSKSQNILIGASPMVKDQTVSKTSSGVEIECLSGNNVIDVSSGTKPKMRIRYKYFSWR